ncbi:cell division protein FtsZ [Methanobrevibacter sp.]
MKFIDDAIKESEQRMEEKTPDKLSSDIDDDLIEMIRGAKTHIFVVGAGGAGNNTISRLNEMGIEGATTIAVNTDAQDLFYSQSAKKILLGRQTSKGLGAGGDPSVGEECAEESEDEIREQLEGADMVFVTCGLGGGTGTGSAPIISKLAKKLGALTVAVATMPFSAEGIKRRENAEQGLEKLQESADTVIVIPNDKLLEVAPNLPLNKAFMVSDEILGRAVKGITELITKKGLVSLDFADIRSIMGGSGMAMIGMGESDTGDRALESVHEALSSPLLDIDISNATGALVNISGSSDLTLHEAEKIVQVVADKLDPEANIIWGTQIDESLQNTVRTTVVVSGIKTNYETGVSSEEETAEEEIDSDSASNQLDDFIDGIF